MKKLVFVIAAILFAMPTLAENAVSKERPSAFNYNYVEGQLRFFDSKNDIFGPRIKGSFDVHSNFSVIGSLGIYEGDTKKNGIKSKAETLRLSGGAAYHASVGEMFDVEALNKMDAVIYAELEYWKTESEASVTTCLPFVGCNTAQAKSKDTDVGVRSGMEIRYAVLDNLEAYADLSLRTTADTDLILGSGVRFAVIENLKLTAGFEIAENNNINLGVRYSF